MSDIVGRAQRLLRDFFTGKTETQRINILSAAFGAFAHDPRTGLETSGAPAVFAVACVTHLVEYGCTDGRRHALSCLLAHIRETEFGTHPPADFSDLPPLLDALCALPSREEERAHLETLLADCRAKAAKYSSLRAVARRVGALSADPELDDPDDIAMVRHLRRHESPTEPLQASTKDYEHILEAIEQAPRAALLGQPGAGKSTTLRRLASEKAEAALADPASPLPILVNLGAWIGDESFTDFLVEQLPGIGDAVAALAHRGRLCLLLDGLNEIPAAQRAGKGPALRRYLGTLGPGTPVVVCCRSEDYSGHLDLGLDTLTLQPLSPQRVREVLVHWFGRTDPEQGEARAARLFWHLAGDPALEGVLTTWRKAGAGEDLFWSAPDIPREAPNVYGKTSGPEDDLWRRHVRNPRALVRLAANPFMLTMLYRVWLDGGETLPRNRGDLFARFTEALLGREGLIRFDPDTGVENRDERADLLLVNLAAVAMSMQLAKRIREYAQEDRRDDLGVLTLIPRRDAIRLLGDESLLKIAEDATILEAADAVQIRFRHQLLQEYFTAIALRQQLIAGSLDAQRLWPRERWWERSGWEEAAVLLAGLYSDDCTPVIRWLADIQHEVAAQCILESGAELADREDLLRDLRNAWLPRLTDIESDPAPEARAAVGRALGLLGLDDRRGVGLRADGLPDIDWVEIPGGEYLYQKGERRTCEPFRIARYPVTHIQFQVFLDAADGYAHDRWWRGLDEPNRNPKQARWPIANHPRETVSWHEAMAFCAWLTERLGLADTGRVIRLPTEWEWERAARGTDGRVYPWGDEYEAGRANIDETLRDAGPHDLGRTSPVGIYPGGASPEGVLDLSGNAWDWCLNQYAKPEQTGRGGLESRVLRGGSWDSNQDYARGRPQQPPSDQPELLCRVSGVVGVPHPLITGPLVTGH